MEPVHYCCGEYHDDMEPCDIYDIVVQGIHSRQVSRRMSKYTSAENPEKPPGFMYKINKTIKNVHVF